MIWRIEGTRNRHTSEMCNHSEVLKWYLQYTSELVAAITMFFTQDVCFGEEMAAFFRKNLADGKAGLSKDRVARAFGAGGMVSHQTFCLVIF